MNQNIVNIFFLVLIIFMFNMIMNKSEKMSNTDIKKIIQKEYKIDVDAIRNLSKLANDLTVNRKLVVPGGLEIKGPLKVDNNITSKSLKVVNKITSKTLEVSHGSDFGTSSNRKMSIVPSSYKNDGTMFAFFNGKKRTFYMIPRITGKLYNNGSLNCEGDITGTNIIVRKDVKANGNGYFGPAYIGKYMKTNNTYAQFSHKNQTGGKNYAALQHSNGTSYFNASNGKNIYFRINNSDKMVLTNSNLGTANNVKIRGTLEVGNDVRVAKTLRAKGNITGRGILATYHMGTYGELAAKRGIYKSCRTVNANGYGSSCKSVR